MNHFYLFKALPISSREEILSNIQTSVTSHRQSLQSFSIFRVIVNAQERYQMFSCSKERSFFPLLFTYWSSMNQLVSVSRRRVTCGDPPWHRDSFPKMPVTEQTWTTPLTPPKQTPWPIHSWQTTFFIASVPWHFGCLLNRYLLQSMLLLWQMPPTPSPRWAHGITAVLYHKYSVVKSLLCLIIQVGSTTELNCLAILWDFSMNNTHDHIGANPCQVSTETPFLTHDGNWKLTP